VKLCAKVRTKGGCTYFTIATIPNTSVEIDEEALKEFKELVYKLGYDYQNRDADSVLFFNRVTHHHFRLLSIS